MAARRPRRPGPRRTVTPATFRTIAWWALAAQVGIVVTGAAVRLTGSGLGCTDWPGCSEDRLVPEWGFHHWVEFGNRLLTFAVTAAAVAAVVGARRRRPYRADLFGLSSVLVGGIVAQALIGALLVLLELDPRLTVLHFVTSIVLITAAVTLVHRSAADGGLRGRSLIGLATVDPPGGPDAPDAPGRPDVPGALRRPTTALLALLAVVVGTGTVVTGSGPHGGDERADRFDLALTTVTRVHAVAMWLFLALLVVVTVSVLRGGDGHPLRRNVDALLGLTGAQAVIGYLQYALGVPAGLVALHVFGSTLVWSVTVALVLKARTTGGDGRSVASRHDPQSESRPVLSET